MLAVGVPDTPALMPVAAETFELLIVEPTPVNAMNTASITVTFSRPRGILVSNVFYCVNLESEWQVVAWHIVCGEFRSR